MKDPHKNIHKDPQTMNLGFLLASVCRLVGGQRRMKLESIGLHHAQGMVLFRLWRSDGMSQRSLASDMHIAPPTISSTLKRMERDGWIERRRDEQDQRIVRVYLTDKSKQLHNDAHASFEEMDRELVTILSEDERLILKKSLVKVYRHMLDKLPPAINTASVEKDIEIGQGR